MTQTPESKSDWILPSTAATSPPEGLSTEAVDASAPIETSDAAEEPKTEPAATAEAASWAGWKLDGLDGTGVARVEGVLTDADSGEPAWLLVRMGRFGHFSAIPYALVAPAAGRVWVPYERDILRQAPRVDAGSPLRREQELELCAYFGIPEDQGRAALVVSRPEGSETARLVASG